MHIDVRSCGAVRLLHASGSTTGPGAAVALRRAFAKLLASDDFIFVLNLIDVVDVDSGFLGELIACRERVRKRGGRTRLVAKDWLIDLLAAARLDNLFETFHDEDEALDSFAPVGETVGIP